MTLSRVLLSAILIGSTMFTFGQSLIGYTTSDDLLTRHPDYASAEKKYAAKQEESSNKLKEIEDQAKIIIADYQKKQDAGASEEELKPLEKELMKLQEAFTYLSNDLEKELEAYKLELFNPILGSIDDALVSVAKKKKLDAIYQSTNSEGVSFVLYAPDNSVITADVLKEIGSTSDYSMLEPFSLDKNKVKIGYTNIEVLITQMPEYDRMEQEVETYKNKLVSDFNVQKAAGEQLMEFYQNSKDEAEKAGLYEEIQKISNELDEMKATFDQKLSDRRNKLMESILEKMQAAIDKVSERNKLTYALNQTNSSGLSTIVYGPDNCDMTHEIMKELGIRILVESKTDFKPKANLKIGYVNVEVVMSGMEEVNQASDRIDAYRLKLAEEIQASGMEITVEDEQLFASKVNEYQAKELQPITEKIQKQIDALAEQKGYDFIINQTSLNVLYAGEKDDLTEILSEMLE